MNYISYTLFGDKELYWKGAYYNIIQSKTYLPDFTRVFYIDNQSITYYKQMIQKLKQDYNFIIIYTKSKTNNKWDLLLQRFKAYTLPDADIILFRDTDSRIRQRQIDAVNQWINTKYPLHIMRDHPQHGAPILAGMWGIKANFAKEIKLINKINNYNNYQKKDADQIFLAKEVYQLCKDKALQHSSYNIKYINYIKEFPTERINNQYVAQIYSSQNNIGE